MKLLELKNILKTLSEISFQFENGLHIPQHFHITEVGLITKDFIDCGGVIRNEKLISFQLWHANDFNHRLKAKNILEIISMAENSIIFEDLEIEVEYQNSTIGKYGLSFNGENFILKSKTTNCLAEDNCGIPNSKPKVSLSKLQDENCSPGSGCC
ncbi:DUF6428 family protein [Flavobacteriales bacterium]|jgi:hypothetical protein|nr:DUF6428 family protein [Flavobacteriales bacterium]